MGSIFKKAQQDQAQSLYQGILDKLEGLPAGTPGWKDVLKDAIDDMVKTETQPSTGGNQESKRDAWDFYPRESTGPICARRWVGYTAYHKSG